MPVAELWELLEANPVIYGAVFVLGTLFGSFANVCIYRWPPTEQFPKGRSVVHPGSHCFDCGASVRWYDNIPILSFVWLRGSCRDCSTKFSPRYLLVEAATGMLFVAVYLLAVLFGTDADPMVRLLHFAIYAAFVFVLVVVTFIDLDHKLILDKLTYPAIPIFYGLGLLLPERDYLRGIIGAAVGYGVIRLISDGYYMLTKREGLGYGDGKLLAIVGAFLGWRAVFCALFLGSFLGTFICVPILFWQGRKAKNAKPDEAVEEEALRHLEVPFGPFLAGGAFIYLYIEPWVDMYLQTAW